MDLLGVTAFKVVAIMAVLLLIWLAMGNRQLGEFTPFDFAVSITAGTIAGAGIADTRIELANVIVSLVLLGLMQIGVSWLSLRYSLVHNRLNYKPAVLVQNGQIIKPNLKSARLTAVTLLQLLREKGVFDITEVELAVLEPQGKLSVLKKAEYLPLTPKTMNIQALPNKILSPVILEGELQEKVLKRLGFSDNEIAVFKKRCGNNLDDIFIAFMDKNKQLHVVREDTDTDILLH